MVLVSEQMCLDIFLDIIYNILYLGTSANVKVSTIWFLCKQTSVLPLQNNTVGSLY